MTNHSFTKRYHRLTPWLLFLVFFGPWLTAQIIYAKREQLTFKTLERGMLVSPAIQVQSLPFYDSAWLGKWQIVYLSTENPDENTKITPVLNQILKAVGKEKHRVAYQIISAQNISSQYLTPGEIALIDPRGWLVMHYRPNADPIGILKDIRRLLRYSHG